MSEVRSLAISDVKVITPSIFRDARGFLSETYNRRSLAEAGISEQKALGGFDLEASRGKPWSRWETGVRREFLHVQYKRARRFVDPGYCLRVAGRCAPHRDGMVDPFRVRSRCHPVSVA